MTPEVAVASVRGPLRPYPFVTLHELVWRQVGRTPHAPAVACGQQQATYAQLRQAAEGAAASLRAAGAGPGTTAGVLLPPGSDLVAGILGVLAAGAAYVQLDPGEPVQRLASRCAQSGVSIALTTRSLAPALPGTVAAVVSADTAYAPPPPARPARLPSRGEGMDAPCAVLFTGGEPAAVTVSHRNMVSAVSGLLHALGTERFRGSLFAAAVGCADGVAQLFPPLVTGGTVVIAESAGVPGGVTIMSATPGELSRLLRAGPLPPAARTLLLSGGQPPSGLTSEVLRRSSVNDMYACYGCAETTTYAIMRRLTSGSEQPAGHATPLGNVTALVLDRYGNPAQRGATGELCVGGPVVACGYPGQPDLTRQRFARVTVAGAAQTVYRTGKACRVLDSGELELPGEPGGAAAQPSRAQPARG